MSRLGRDSVQWETLVSCVTVLRLAWRQGRAKTATAVVLMLLSAVAAPLGALALKVTTDAVLQQDVGSAVAGGLAVAVLAICVLTMGHFAHVAYFELSELNTLQFDCELIELANGSAGLAHHERAEYSDRIAVLRQELPRLGWSGMSGLLSTVSLGLAMVVTGVVLAELEPLLLLLPLAAVAPVLASQRGQRLRGQARDDAAAHTRRARHLFGLATSADAAKEIRVSRARDLLLRRHANSWAAASEVHARAEWRATALLIGGQLVFSLAYIAAVLLVVRDAAANRATVGDVVLVIALATQVNHQVTQGVMLLGDLQRMAQALSRLRWLRELIARQAPEPADEELPSTISGGIDLVDVGFTYPGTDRPVLADVNLHLPAGTTVALVGENGSGKTTLVKLLCRFYQPTAGTIKVDGVDLQRVPLDRWRSRIAAGFQDFVRFELTAQRAVAVGDLTVLDDREAALRGLARARSGGIVTQLPDGLDTQLGKSYTDGAELSGGQWQKLALGRAMMREGPLLLVLDEPTAALDAQAEHSLFEQYAESARRIGKKSGGITLLISHRFSTVRMADVILVIGDGRIVESGDHDSLMARDGLYAELFTLQANSYR
ncbi:ABC transporter ATP-binding protein [Verrucosispora sp. WMMD573]|uniref:ABC transporter ATP-binding protein n=1 Tax=Verrucosispora sp. WMMD573 TaxID=3015149 RepID=UPI00248D30DF|nr:ABC transporter ATP-binding protein [Verrucosispora sp. WMMD573]WBB53732.1 ABC transporter ATP-binding protein [Verrucosispora sp. WMMD573]